MENAQAEKRVIEAINGIPLTRYWLIPTAVPPKMFTPHPQQESSEISRRMQAMWDRFYAFPAIWKRSAYTLRCRRGSPLCCCRCCTADVRGHRHLHRQRAPEEGENIGALAGAADPQDTPGKTHAEVELSSMGTAGEDASCSCSNQPGRLSLRGSADRSLCANPQTRSSP